MASGNNRINFFISMDTVMAYLEKHVVDQEVSADTGMRTFSWTIYQSMSASDQAAISPRLLLY